MLERLGRISTAPIKAADKLVKSPERTLSLVGLNNSIKKV
jgi:hypothetical protein